MNIRSRVLILGTAFTVLAVSLAGTTLSGASNGGAQGSLTIDNEVGTLWPCSFNPLNASDAPYSVGPVYETLEFVDTLDAAKVTPWLATGSAWSNDNKTLTFTIRSGVKWSDGTALSAADVLYTFDLLKKYPALDTNSVWSVISSVSQVGANKIVFNFKTSAVPYFYYIADQIAIVPKHVLEKVANPVAWVDPNPVGDGAYLMSQCTPEDIKYTANPNYWQPGLPKIETVNYPAFTSANTANEYLANGQAQWGSEFIPDIKSYYLDKSPSNHMWLPPITNVSLFPNLTAAPLNNLAVRKAIADGIDRSKISEISEYGYLLPANQGGVVTPTFSSWLDKDEVKSANIGYDPSKAKSILEAAGYKMGGDGVFEKNGKELTINVIVIGGYSDMVADLQIMTGELAQIGIKLTTSSLSASAFNSDLFTGKYQMAYNFESGGPTPYYEMRQVLYSKNSAPIGQIAASNWERYSSPQTDALINEYGASTDVATQHSIVDKLQNVMLTSLPVIPIVEFVDWFQYSTKSISGWPTPANPYAQPGAYMYPDWGIILLHLKLK